MCLAGSCGLWLEGPPVAAVHAANQRQWKILCRPANPALGLVPQGDCTGCEDCIEQLVQVRMTKHLCISVVSFCQYFSVTNWLLLWQNIVTWCMCFGIERFARPSVFVVIASDSNPSVHTLCFNEENLSKELRRHHNLEIFEAIYPPPPPKWESTLYFWHILDLQWQKSYGGGGGRSNLTGTPPQ